MWKGLLRKERGRGERQVKSLVWNNPAFCTSLFFFQTIKIKDSFHCHLSGQVIVVGRENLVRRECIGGFGLVTGEEKTRDGY